MTYGKLAKLISKMTPEQKKMKVIVNIDSDRMEYPIMYFELDEPYTNNIAMRLNDEDNTLAPENEGKIFLKVNHPILELC
jgi:hypothetical protein